MLILATRLAMPCTASHSCSGTADSSPGAARAFNPPTPSNCSISDHIDGRRDANRAFKRQPRNRALSLNLLLGAENPTRRVGQAPPPAWRASSHRARDSTGPGELMVECTTPTHATPPQPQSTLRLRMGLGTTRYHRDCCSQLV